MGVSVQKIRRFPNRLDELKNVGDIVMPLSSPTPSFSSHSPPNFECFVLKIFKLLDSARLKILHSFAWKVAVCFVCVLSQMWSISCEGKNFEVFQIQLPSLTLLQKIFRLISLMKNSYQKWFHNYHRFFLTNENCFHRYEIKVLHLNITLRKQSKTVLVSI